MGRETLKVKAEYTGPAENDVPAMIAAFDQAIAKKPKGIAVFAYDPVWCLRSTRLLKPASRW